MTFPSQHSAPREIVAQLYDFFGEGRLDETFELMDSQVVLSEPGDATVLPWAGEFRGHDGLRRFYSGLAEGLSAVEIDPTSMELLSVGDDRVLALATERGVSVQTGRNYVTQSAWLWTVRGGRITRLKAFHDTAAMEAALRR